MISRLAIVQLLGGAVLIANVASAQTIRGVVVDDSTGGLLEGVTLSLLDNRGRDLGRTVRTALRGEFIVHAPGPGDYLLRAARIGYSPLTSLPIRLSTGEAATMSLRMSTAAQRLGSVVIADRRRLNGDELLSDLGFDLRRSKGTGKFLDSADLSVYKRHPSFLFLTEHGGLGLYLRGTVATESIQMASGLDAKGNVAYCKPELWIDGFEQRPYSGPYAEQWRLWGLSADLIHGIEVYSKHQLPSAGIAGELGQRQSMNSVRQRCGMVVIWTKAFVADRKKKQGGQ